MVVISLEILLEFMTRSLVLCGRVAKVEDRYEVLASKE